MPAVAGIDLSMEGIGPTVQIGILSMLWSLGELERLVASPTEYQW